MQSSCRLLANGSAVRLAKQAVQVLPSRSCYQSPYNVKSLYEGSSTKPHPASESPPSTSNGGFSGVFPLETLSISYDSSSRGPGGQHVNKTSSRATVRFHLDTAEWIPQNVRGVLKERYHHRVNRDGYFLLRSDRTRMARLNLADCLDKLRFTIREIEDELTTKQPDSETVAKWEKRKEKASRERLVYKRSRSDIKQSRRGDDDSY